MIATWRSLITACKHTEFRLPIVDFSLPYIDHGLPYVDFPLPYVDHGLPHVDFLLPNVALSASIFAIWPPHVDPSVTTRVTPPPFVGTAQLMLTRRRPCLA